MNYNPNDVYNVDETEQFYRMVPDLTLLVGYDYRDKQPKYRITIFG